MSLYGYERETTPNLERWAREQGVVFDNAWANAGCTFPSVNSLLTSRWPDVFLAPGRGVGMGIAPQERTLAERLRAAGFSTAAVSASVIVRATPSSVNTKGGFGAGFESFDEACEKRSAACVNERAAIALGQLRTPFLLYLHYLDPHAPYRPPAWSHESFAAAGEPVRPWAARGDPETIYQALYPRKGERHAGGFTPAEARHLSDLYDDEVRFLDARLGSLRSELGSRGVLDETIVVLASDHGEELLDDGEWGHCRDHAYEPVLATPLVFFLPDTMPGQARGRRTAPAANVDIVPTLLDLLDVEHEPLAGRSLAAAMARDDDRQRHLFAVQGARWAVRDASRVASYDERSGRWSSDTPPRDLRVALVRWMKERRQEVPTAGAVGAADDLEVELRALGYL